MNKPTVPLPTDEAGHTPHCGSEIPAAQTQETTKEGGQAYLRRGEPDTADAPAGAARGGA